MASFWDAIPIIISDITMLSFEVGITVKTGAIVG